MAPLIFGSIAFLHNYTDSTQEIRDLSYALNFMIYKINIRLMLNKAI